MEELIHYIIEKGHGMHACHFDIEEVSNILNIQKDVLKEHLKQHIMAYPEKTMEGKIDHFRVFERFFRRSFIGEDKNRFFLWSTTPFYSIDLFRASINVPQRSKEHFILYRNFFERLNPALARIPYYDKLVPLSLPCWLLKTYLSVFELLQRLLHEPGTASPFDLLFGKRTQDGTDKIKNLILKLAGKEGGFNFLEYPRVVETIEKTTNPAKLERLATLVVYANLVKSSRAR